MFCFFYYSGEGGIGKTCSLGILALDWAEKAREEVKKFTFVFLISLRHVDGNKPLEAIIMEQHGRLKTQQVTMREIKTILKENPGPILILMDGYDEYTSGCNDDVDELLLNGRDNCLIILTSRPGYYLPAMKNRMDEEVSISGFSYDNTIKCARLYLESDEGCQEFLMQAEKAEIYGLLHVPIILLMACTVFSEKQRLPSSKTKLFGQVVKMCVSRTTLKIMGKTAGEVENLHELMVKLGKLAWNALNRKDKQLLIYKVCCEMLK